MKEQIIDIVYSAILITIFVGGGVTVYFDNFIHGL